jgi:hypothetical protein
MEVVEQQRVVEGIAGGQMIRGRRRLRLDQRLPGRRADHAVGGQTLRALEGAHRELGAAIEQAVDLHRAIVTAQHGLQVAHRAAQIGRGVREAVVKTEQGYRHGDSRAV